VIEMDGVWVVVWGIERELRTGGRRVLRRGCLCCGSGGMGSGLLRNGWRSWVRSGDLSLGLRGVRLGTFGLLRFRFVVGREAIVVVAVDGVADGFAPAVSAKGVDVFVLGEADGLQLSLEHVGNGAGESGFYVAADHGGDDAREGGAEIAGGEVVAREEAGEVLGEFFRGLGAGLFLGVVEAEVGMMAGAGSAATAAIGERE